MSTTIKLKRATPAADAAAVASPAQPAVQAAPVVQQAPVVQVQPAVQVQPEVPTAPVVETPEQLEAREFAEFKARKAAAAAAQTVPVVAVQVVTPPPVVTVPPVVMPPQVEVISTPEDAAEKTVVTQGHYKAVPGLEGAWDSRRHAIVPRLQIVQGQGELARKHPQGTLLLQDEVFLPAPNATTAKVSVSFVPFQLRLQYRERLSPEQQAGGLKPRTAFSLEEVGEMGGTTEWLNNVRPNWEETARAALFIILPTGIDHPAFDAIEGLPGKYTMAVYYAAGVAFPYFAKPIVTAAMSTLKVPGEAPGTFVPYMPKRFWKFMVDAKRWGNFNPLCLVANQTTVDTDAATRQYINQFVNATVSDE
jgi:hypothetical protein